MEGVFVASSTRTASAAASQSGQWFWQLYFNVYFEVNDRFRDQLFSSALMFSVGFGGIARWPSSPCASLAGTAVATAGTA